MHITTKTQIMIITETDTIGIIVTQTISQAVLKKAIIMQLIISKNRFHQPKEGMEENGCYSIYWKTLIF